MFCEKCGKELYEGAKFCSGCGAVIEGSTAENTVTESSTEAEESVKKKNKNPAVLIAAVIIVIVVALVIGGVTLYSIPKIRYERQLSLGQKYLDELDYDKAIAAYRAAIEIDPKNPDAYLMLAQVYLDNDDESEAMAILHEGIDKTDNSDLKELLKTNFTEEQIEAYNNSYAAENRDSEGQSDNGEEKTKTLSGDWEKEIEKYANLNSFINDNRIGDGAYFEYFMKQEDLKAAYAPIIGEYEEYIEFLKSNPGIESEMDYTKYLSLMSAYEQVGTLYALTGDMEKARDCAYLYSTYYAEFSDYITLTDDGFYKNFDTVYTYDAYGRRISEDRTTREDEENGIAYVYITYGEGMRISSETVIYENGDERIAQHYYDEDGRILKTEETRDGEHFEFEYSYPSPGIAVCKSVDRQGESQYEYNEYSCRVY